MSLAEALKGIKETQPVPKAAGAKPQKIRRPHAEHVEDVSSREGAKDKPPAKSANPDYERLGLYVRKDLRRNAERKFEDSGGRDLSDLLEQLLTKYLNA